MKNSNLILATLAFAIVGCSGGDYGGTVEVTPAQSAARIEDEIKKIENNPNMPPQAKQHAIAALRASAEMGKGQKAAAPTTK